jgi:HAD superfamily hydrolase (TIGR01549 family)
MGALRAITFDIGDTLVFDAPPLPERLKTALGQVGLAYDAARFSQAYRIGEDYAIARYLEGLSYDTPEVLCECIARILTALDVPPLTEPHRDALLQSFAAVPWTRTVHPQASGLLETLRHRGFRIGAVSDWEETLPELLAELALAPYLDALAVSAIVGVTKPSPRLFQHALRQMDIPPEQTLHVGDWYALDVCGAQAAGMGALLFDHQLRTPHADCPRVETFDALADFLLSLPCPAP